MSSVSLSSCSAAALPVLYSFRRCPYAMRARLALRISGVSLEWREIILKNKPAAMLAISPKGTVPVLQLPPEGDRKGVEVVDESLDIMLWALQQSDPEHWLASWDSAAQALVRENDQVFKAHLDRYKYADRYPAAPAEVYRQQGEVFLGQLEARLQAGVTSDEGYLFGSTPSLADMAIFPFVRQFAHVDKDWFCAAPYPRLIAWLDKLLEGELFLSIMRKAKPWQEQDEPLLF